MGSRKKPGDEGYRAELYNPAIHKSPEGKTVTKSYSKSSGLVVDESNVVLPEEQQTEKGKQVIQEQRVIRTIEGSVNFPPGSVNQPPTISREFVGPPTREEMIRRNTPRVGGILSDTKERKRFLGIPLKTKDERVGLFQDDPFLTKAREEGLKVNEGAVPAIFTPAGAKGAASLAVKGYRGLRATKSGMFLTGAVGGILQSQTIYTGFEKGEELTRTKEQKKYIKEIESKGIDFGKAVDEALREEARVIAKTPKGQDLQFFGKSTQLDTAFFGKPFSLSPRNIAFSLPGGSMLAGSELAFSKELQKQLVSQGLTTEQASKGVIVGQRERKARSSGELASLLNVERASESIGRNLVRREFVKSTGEQVAKNKIQSTLFKKTFSNIGLAGVFEGSVGEVIQRQARGQEQSLKGTLFAGGAGGLTAGLLGGTIAAKSVTKPKTSKVLTFGANILDPLELPGDIAQNIVEKGIGRVTKKTFINPRVKTLSNSFILGVGTPTKSSTPTKAQTRTQTKTKQTFGTFQDLVDISEGKRKPTPSPSPIPTPAEVFKGSGKVNVGSVPIGDKQGRSKTEVNIFTPSPTSTPTMSSFVPTVAPIFRLPPPIPLVLPGSGMGTNPQLGKNIKFVNELAFGKQILGSLTGTTKRRKVNVKKKSKKNKKR